MLFHSVQFLVFLCVTLALYWVVHRVRLARLTVLFIASVLFYSAWRPLPLALFAGIACIMWIAAWQLHKRKSKAVVAAAVVAFLVILALFKYADLFYATSVDLAKLAGFDWHYQRLNWLFPLGISFGVFQAIHYVVDVYRGHITEKYGFWKTLLYLLFFPHLIAGPIVRAPYLLSRFDDVPSLAPGEGSRALFRIATGLAKKLLIADLLASGIVDPVFNNPALYPSTEIAIAVVAYTFQIYYDFSAYSDIAIGAAALFGFRFPENFNKPYVARNLPEFWNRWHMTLSNWLRDYLYFPLGGSKHGTWKTWRNLMIVMVLGGLWHGAGWRFALWGFIHGIGLWIVRGYWLIRKIDPRHPPKSTRLGIVAGILATLTYVIFSRVFFRANDVPHAIDILKRIGEGSIGFANISLVVWITLSAAIVLHYLPIRWYESLTRLFIWLPAPARAVGLVALALVVRQVASFEVKPYIYFQF